MRTVGILLFNNTARNVPLFIPTAADLLDWQSSYNVLLQGVINYTTVVHSARVQRNCIPPYAVRSVTSLYYNIIVVDLWFSITMIIYRPRTAILDLDRTGDLFFAYAHEEIIFSILHTIFFFNNNLNSNFLEKYNVRIHLISLVRTFYFHATNTTFYDLVMSFLYWSYRSFSIFQTDSTSWSTIVTRTTEPRRRSN